LKRDSYFENDGFGILLDPINNQSNGYFFGVSARGSQSEVAIGMNFSEDYNWNSKWYSKVSQYEEYWICEMAIPFYTIRYDDKQKTWGVNFVRNDLKNNIFSTWTLFSANFGAFDLGYTGSMLWQSKPLSAFRKIAVIPSMTITQNMASQEENKNTTTFTPSLDAKIGITPSLNLDLTVNPDFSQIEVDQ